MSITHEQRERLPELVAKATDGPWWDAGNSVNSSPHPICHAYMVNATNNTNLIALAPAMAETILEDGKTIAAMREALADTRSELELLRGGETCDHSVGVCWCDYHRLVSRIDAILNDGAQS